MVEGARLESVFRGNSNVGSNPTLSAILESITYGYRTKLSDDIGQPGVEYGYATCALPAPSSGL